MMEAQRLAFRCGSSLESQCHRELMMKNNEFRRGRAEEQEEDDDEEVYFWMRRRWLFGNGVG